MRRAVDKNGKKIFKGRYVLKEGRCFTVEGLDEYKGQQIVLLKPLKEEYLFPVGLSWSHSPYTELTMLSKQEALLYILKQ